MGLSHTTGQITHHIAPEIDAERDNLLADLRTAGALLDEFWIDGFQSERTGKNGGAAIPGGPTAGWEWAY